MEAALQTKLRWERLETLFHRAMDFPPPERYARVSEWCSSDPGMLTDLLGMLASNSSIDALLHSIETSQTEGLEGASAASDPWIGRTLGTFQVERLLGRGGMGVVYLARRVSGGFTQTVAVKLIARHLVSAPALHQFDRERDALARLQHRNIAGLIDAGVTPEGTPYVAMDFVEGRRLDEVFDDQSISRKQKLDLVLQLCDAVSYVHRNLVLHRDLKPGNVLVTAEGVLKLLDFGTLKLLGPAAQPTSEMTQAGMRAMTLRYASPEYIRGESVSTATDVYSVGMVLYRLLAGRLPEAPSNLSVDEYLQWLQATPPSPPSKAADVPAANSQLPSTRDLDAIALHATRSEQERRYASVDALAEDIRRYLRQEPVTARPDTVAYHATKFYQRNRGAVLASSLILVVLAFGLGLMRREAKRAEQEHQRAEAGVQEERKLAHLLLFDYFQTLSEIPGSTDAQHKAATEAISYLDQLNAVTQSPELQLDTVQGYRKLGLLLGSPYQANLGDAPRAIETLKKASSLAERLLRRDPDNLDVQTAFIGVQSAMSQAYFAMKQPQRSVALLLLASEMARRIAKNPHADWKMLVQCAAVFKTLGDAYSQHADGQTQDFEKAVAALEESGRLYQASVEHGSTNYSGTILVPLYIGLLVQTFDVDRALSYYQKGFDIIAALPTNERAKLSTVRLDQTLRTKVGAIYISLGKTQEANAYLEPLRAPVLHAIAADPIDTRARDDLIGLDTSTLDVYPLANSKATREMLQEYLETTDWLVRNHPGDNEWQFEHAEAPLLYAKLYLDRGDTRAAAPYLAKGLPEIVTLARQPDADAETLSLAAKALVFAQRDLAHDPQLAVEFAQRAVANAHPAVPDQLLTVAEAQQAAGLEVAATASAQSAMDLLIAHPRSFEHAADLHRAGTILQHK